MVQPRILITGGHGFVGRYVQAWLAEESDGAAFPLGPEDGLDVTKPESIEAALKRIKPTAVIHLAAIAAPAAAEKARQRAYDINVSGSFNVAQAILDHAPSCRLVFAGSAEAYGRSFAEYPDGIGVDAPFRPNSFYGATKAAADLLLETMSLRELDCIRFRAFNHTGPGQAPDFVVPAFASQVAAIVAGNHAPVMYVGNLDARRDFLDVRDIAAAYGTAAIAPQGSLDSRALNLASGKPQKIADILASLIAMSGMDIEVRTDPKRVRPNDLPVTKGDISDTLNVLGWTPQRAFDDTLKSVFNAFLEQQGGQSRPTH